MGDSVAPLVQLLEAAANLLHRHGVEFWAKWLSDDATLIRDRDFRGVEHLLTAYGGMGSLNDVFICRENGHLIAAEEVKAANTELQDLLGRIFKLANRLRREELKAANRDRAI